MTGGSHKTNYKIQIHIQKYLLLIIIIIIINYLLFIVNFLDPNKASKQKTNWE